VQHELPRMRKRGERQTSAPHHVIQQRLAEMMIRFSQVRALGARGIIKVIAESADPAAVSAMDFCFSRMKAVIRRISGAVMAHALPGTTLRSQSRTSP